MMNRFKPDFIIDPTSTPESPYDREKAVARVAEGMRRFGKPARPQEVLEELGLSHGPVVESMDSAVLPAGRVEEPEVFRAQEPLELTKVQRRRWFRRRT